MASMGTSRKRGLPPDGRALLEWFKTIPGVSQQSQKLVIDDLRDGRDIWNALQYIRPEVFSGSLPEETKKDGNWLAHWQNLKHIYKCLASYVTSEAGALPRSLDALDLQAVAKDESTSDMVKLLKMVLFAAVHADDNSPYISPMLSLPADQQALVQQAIMEFQEQPDDDMYHDEPRMEPTGGKDLYWEEQLAAVTRERDKLAQEKRDLQQELRDQTDRNSRLQNNNINLQDKLSSVQEKLENSSGSTVGGSVLKDIEAKVKDQEDHIAYQETQLIDLQKSNDDYQREVTRLREFQDKFQPLQDTHDELKAENDALKRKTNAMEKYKAKLATLAEIEKENDTLRFAIEELREVNKDGTQAMSQAKAFQNQIDGMSRMIGNIEQELFDSKMMKQQLDDDTKDLRKQLEDANSRYEQDQAMIRDLQDQVQSSSPRLQGTGNLENELEEGEAPRKLEKANIQSEHATNKLREALEESKAREESLQAMLQTARTRAKKLEGQIEEGFANKRSDADQFKGNQHHKASDPENLQKDRDFLAAEENDSVILMDKQEVHRMQDQACKASEYEARITDLQVQVLEYKKLLSHAGSSPASVTDIDATKALKEQLASQVSQIADLKKQVESSKPALLKASEQLQLKQKNESLTRENKLIASAFYDLSSRLQLNNVSLQRRSEAPRSFLNKQRLLVSQATAVRMPR